MQTSTPTEPCQGEHSTSQAARGAEARLGLLSWTWCSKV
jgi:hypothetical protein